MLDSRDPDISPGEDSATVSVGHILGQRVYYRFAVEIHSLDLVAMVFRSGQKCGLDFQSGMKAFPLYGEFAVKS